MEISPLFVDISSIIVGLTAILFYFGKIIADTKVEKYERTDYILSGLPFTLIFIFFPIALNIFFYQAGRVTEKVTERQRAQTPVKKGYLHNIG